MTGRVGSLSELLPSMMGVRVRCITSGSEEPKPSGGSCGSGEEPSVGIPLGGSFIEGRREGDEGALVFGDVGVTPGTGAPCTRPDNISLRRDRTAEVRSSRGSMTSAASRSIKSNWVKAILGGEKVWVINKHKLTSREAPAG